VVASIVVAALVLVFLVRDPSFGNRLARLVFGVASIGAVVTAIIVVVLADR
jgi:hypothetical protein